MYTDRIGITVIILNWYFLDKFSILLYIVCVNLCISLVNLSNRDHLVTYICFMKLFEIHK